MDKDFDYDDFVEFMNSISGYIKVSDTLGKLEQIDNLESQVASRPCYDNVNDLLNSVRNMT